MQATQESFGTSRRPLDVEDYIDIARRHKAWVIGPAFAALVIAVVAAFLWPDTYVSTGTIKVMPAQVPDRLVPTNINVELSQRINLMATTILNRANLTNIINTYGLFPRDVKRVPMEDLIEAMVKTHIKIGTVQSLSGTVRGGAFQVAFAYENRYIAQKVCNKLLSSFIDENTRIQSSQSRTTTNFLKDQQVAAKEKLDKIEQSLTAFRIQNAGRLPEERQINVSALNSLETRLTNLNSSISRANQEKLVLESQLRMMQDQLKQFQSAAPIEAQVVARNQQLAQLDRDIQQLENSLAALKEHYTPTHPDVKRTEVALALLRRQREDLTKKEEEQRQEDVKKAAAAPKKGPLAPREAKELEQQISRMQLAIQLRDDEIQDMQNQTHRVTEQIKVYQQRIETAPLSDQQYAGLVRDYDLAKQEYHQLTSKLALSERATQLEDNKQGETLELLDEASLPATPTQPKRWIIIGVGIAIGLAAGIILAAAREMKDTALKNLKDVRAYTRLNILGCIPLLENDLVVRRRKRLAWLAWSTALIVGGAVMSGSVYYYYSTRL